MPAEDQHTTSSEPVPPPAANGRNTRNRGRAALGASSPLKRWEFRVPRRGKGLEIPAQCADLTRARTVVTCIDSSESMRLVWLRGSHSVEQNRAREKRDEDLL